MTITVDLESINPGKFLPAFIVLGIVLKVLLVAAFARTFPKTSKSICCGMAWLYTRPLVTAAVLVGCVAGMCEIMPNEGGYPFGVRFGGGVALFFGLIISLVTFIGTLCEGDLFYGKGK